MTSPPYLNYFLSGKNTKTVASASRRKHQKSRRGCATCKRRHIRCDETWPRCHNCTKHQSDCHYPEIHHETASGNTTSSKDPGQSSKERGSLETSEVEEELCALQVTSPVVQTKNKPGSVNISPHSLDPGVGSAAPLTPQTREQLAFCKSALGHYVRPNKPPISFLHYGLFLTSTADTDEIVSIALPIHDIRDAWNQTIIPLALAEPMLFHSLLSFAACNLHSLRNTPLAECRELVYSNKTAAISLINQRLTNIEDASEQTIISAIAAIIVLVGQEVRYHTPAGWSRRSSDGRWG